MGFDLWDLGALAALASIGIGLWWERPSLALIVVGGLVLLGCAWGSRVPHTAKEGGG